MSFPALIRACKVAAEDIALRCTGVAGRRGKGPLGQSRRFSFLYPRVGAEIEKDSILLRWKQF